MKKYILRMSLLFMPLFIWYVLFAIFEPYNYWGLSKSDRTVISNRPLAIMQKAKRIDYDNVENILLGDSRTSHFQSEYIAEVTGFPTYNLAFGGASLQEEIDLFWWAVERFPVKKISLQTGFWTINGVYNSDRIKELIDISNNSIRFLMTWDYHVETFNQILEKQKEYKPLVYTDEERLENKIYYAKDIIFPGVEEFQISYDCIEQLKNIADYCKANDIEFVIILPPVDDSIWKYVIEPLGMQPKLYEYKQTLSQFATVYDMEYPELDAYSCTDYADGFHFDGLQALDSAPVEEVKNYPAIVDYIDQMYNGKTDHMHIWQGGQIINP